MNKFIDYKLLSQAITFYESLGYRMLTVLWFLPENEFPKELDGERSFFLKNGVFENFNVFLVGSAEQSIISLFRNGQENGGLSEYGFVSDHTKYMAVTPCFRDEEVYDDLHHAYFMKLELINIPCLSDKFFQKFHDQSQKIDNQLVLNNTLKDAWLFFEHVLNMSPYRFLNGNNLTCEKSENSNSIIEFDIKLNGIEIGSYGQRKLPNSEFNGNYIYGTGLALPRFSNALDK